VKAIMLTLTILASAAKHMMTSKGVEIDGKLTSVSRTGGPSAQNGGLSNR